MKGQVDIVFLINTDLVFWKNYIALFCINHNFINRWHTQNISINMASVYFVALILIPRKKLNLNLNLNYIVLGVD
jgi:hypothetical protein